MCSSCECKEVRRSRWYCTISKTYDGNEKAFTSRENERWEKKKKNYCCFNIIIILLKKAGLTQAELAQMCNVKPVVIGEYESGKGGR